jgi:tetratricopeptide (TPR) repeat protein
MFSLMTFQQNKIWENGATLWTHVLKYYTNSEMALGNKARYQREVLKDYKAALDNFSKSLIIKQKPETHNGRGKTYFDMGNGAELTQKALADYSAAIALPSLAKLEKKAIGEIYANRGAAYGRLSEELKDRNYLQLALVDINKSVEYDTKNKNSYLNGYLICSQLGNPQGAIENIDKYIALSPNEADMYYSRGMENRRLNNLQVALKDFNDALMYAPNDVKRAKSAAERAEKTKNTAYYYLERARTYVSMQNLGAAKADLASYKGFGDQVPPDMKAYE